MKNILKNDILEVVSYAPFHQSRIGRFMFEGTEENEGIVVLESLKEKGLFFAVLKEHVHLAPPSIIPGL